MSHILVTGGNGQIGSDLVVALRERHGDDRVIASDIEPATPEAASSGPHEVLDVRDRSQLRDVIHDREVGTVFHLASLLSATGEKKPSLCWETNTEGLRNVLEVAKDHGLRVFWPSSIAVFGPNTPRQDTPQVTVLDPTTMYGVTKVAGEMLCRYHAEAYGVDVRSVRFPGIIGYKAPPGGGTTDYAINMFSAALAGEAYTSFVRGDCRLPMMYMPDAVRSMLEIMEADGAALTVRTSYNLTAMSFSAEELAAEIRRHIPDFECRYEPDFRQEIADTWPAVVDDSTAREDWGWRHRYDLPTLVEDMLQNLPHGGAAQRDERDSAGRSASFTANLET